MNNNLLLVPLVFFILKGFSLSAQEVDSIPPSRKIDSIAVDSLGTVAIDSLGTVAIDSLGTIAIDTTVVDTVVIRKVQDRIKFIPRGVDLMNPIISFNRTKALGEKPNRFRIPSFWTNVNKLGANFSEVAFVNWNAGGNNSISALGMSERMLFRSTTPTLGRPRASFS